MSRYQSTVSRAVKGNALAGLVLCGGPSRRMGRPKALLPWDGQTLVEVIVNRLRPLCQPIVIAASPEIVLPPFPHDIVVRDEVAYKGPLVGLAQAMAVIPADCTAVFVTACDLPFLQANIVQRLWNLYQTDCRKDACEAVVVREPEGRWQPFVGIYSREIEFKASHLRATGHRRMLDLLNALQVRPVETAELVDLDSDLLCLRNVNEWTAFQEAQQWAELMRSFPPDPSLRPAGDPVILPPETENR